MNDQHKFWKNSEKFMAFMAMLSKRLSGTTEIL